MRVLLSTIGSRGDVQPLVALAHQLRTLRHEARLCVPPDFRDWIEGLGFPVVPIGPDVRQASMARLRATAPPSQEQLRQIIDATVATQFETIGVAAEGCDVIVSATALQVAARSNHDRSGSSKSCCRNSRVAVYGIRVVARGLPRQPRRGADLRSIQPVSIHR